MRILEIIKLPHIKNNAIFIRLDPEDLQTSLENLLNNLMDFSWLSRFDEEFMINSFKTRAEQTIKDIEKKILNSSNDKITKEVGEYLVSEFARESLVSHLKYLDIPLSELIGMKISGNPGFDFHSQNNATDIIIFGEAKYSSSKNAYGLAMDQISRFIDDKKDIMQIIDLKPFCSETALQNASIGLKGFAVAFAAKNTSSFRIIDGIIKHREYSKLSDHEEVIYVAVNI